MNFNLYNDQEQLYELSFNAKKIKEKENPSIDFLKEAIANNNQILEYIKNHNQYNELVDYAIEIEPCSIKYKKNATETERINCLKRDVDALYFLKNPTEKEIQFAYSIDDEKTIKIAYYMKLKYVFTDQQYINTLKKTSKIFMYISNPSIEVQREFVFGLVKNKIIIDRDFRFNIFLLNTRLFIKKVIKKIKDPLLLMELYKITKDEVVKKAIKTSSFYKNDAELILEMVKSE